MAGLWAEDFERFPNVASMLDGVWAEVAAQWALSATNPRTGSKCLRVGNVAFQPARKTLLAAKTEAGVACAVFMDTLPTSEFALSAGIAPGGLFLPQYRDAANNPQVSIGVGTDGRIVVWNRGWYTGGGAVQGTQLGASAQCLTANAYHHIESFVGIDAATGFVEVRVNGVTVLNLTNVNTDPTGAGEVSQIAFHNPGINGVCVLDLDDVHAWDTAAGEGPTSFAGNASVFNRPMIQDTATADWSLSAGSDGYALLADNSDATYIEAVNVGDRSSFVAGPLPADVVAVIYQQLNWRAVKTAAGDCSVAPSFVSGGSETVTPAFPLTTVETWRWGIVGDDPDTAAPWTPAAVDASQPTFERTL